MAPAPRSLVFCRVGEGSLHREWMGDPAARSYDVWLDCYCPPERWAGEPARVTDGRGTTKWLRVAALLRERPGDFEPYDVLFFPDDDLRLSAPALEEFLALFRRHRLALAQPALVDGCHWSHELTLANSAFQLRYTNFVEIMGPAFSRDALRAVAPTFEEGRTGWGIDLVWSRVLGDPTGAIAVVDATPMVHTRPVGDGGLYTALGVDPGDEVRAVTARRGVALPFAYRQFGGVARSGARVGRVLFLARAFLGAPPSQRWRAHFWKIMRATLSRRPARPPADPPRGP